MTDCNQTTEHTAIGRLSKADYEEILGALCEWCRWGVPAVWNCDGPIVHYGEHQCKAEAFRRLPRERNV